MPTPANFVLAPTDRWFTLSFTIVVDDPLVRDVAPTRIPVIEPRHRALENNPTLIRPIVTDLLIGPAMVTWSWAHLFFVREAGDHRHVHAEVTLRRNAAAQLDVVLHDPVRHRKQLIIDLVNRFAFTPHIERTDSDHVTLHCRQPVSIHRIGNRMCLIDDQPIEQRRPIECELQIKDDRLYTRCAHLYGTTVLTEQQSADIAPV